jgi:hypothetical protein
MNRLEDLDMPNTPNKQSQVFDLTGAAYMC